MRPDPTPNVQRLIDAAIVHLTDMTGTCLPLARGRVTVAPQG